MRNTVTTTGPEDRLLARTGWLLTVQIAGAITGVVLLVGVLAVGLTITRQHQDSERELREAAAHWNVINPPPCVWMFDRTDAGVSHRTPSAPGYLPVAADLGAVSDSHPVRLTQHRIHGLDYQVRTERQPGRIVQVVLDRRYQGWERQRMYLAVGVGELIGLLAALVTGRRLARRSIRPLGEAMIRQRWFIADASHELRTPLTQIHTRSQLLERRLRTGGNRDELADEVRRLTAGTRQLSEVVDDLLLSAQLRQGGHRLDPVDLGAIVTEVAAAEQARAQARDITLRVSGVDGPDGTPNAPGPARYRVRGIPTSLRRVVNALLDNALGHTPGPGEVHLELSMVDDGRAVRLTVTDSGIGFDPAQADRIFERFARGEQGEGRRFGLGLALVREVLDSHGGTITASSAPDRGATFTVQLPAADPAGDRPVPAPAQGAAVTSSRRVTSAM